MSGHLPTARKTPAVNVDESSLRGPAVTTQVSFGRISMNILLRQMSIDGRRFEFAPKEFSLLYVLLERSGEAADYDSLHQAVGAVKGDRSVESLIYRLRKKLVGSGYGILSVRGKGYCIVNEDEEL